MFEAGVPLLALLTASIRGHQPHSPAARTTRTRARKKAPASSRFELRPETWTRLMVAVMRLPVGPDPGILPGSGP